MNIIKKQGIGAYLTVASIVLSIVGLITYGATIAIGDGQAVANGSELFLVASDFGAVTATGIIALVLLVLGLVCSQVKMDGIVGTVVELVSYACRAIAPAMLIYTFVFFLNSTLTGLGWTFFSNAELEIFPEAITAGKFTIATLIVLLVNAIVAIVASFFTVQKKEA